MAVQITKDKSIAITILYTYKGPEKFAFINFKQINTLAHT
jgi:hypothetical protein